MRPVFIGILALAFSLEVYSASGIVAELSQQGEGIHLEFRGQNQWDYNVEKIEEKNNTYIDIQVPRLNEASVVKIKSYKSPEVQSVQVKRDGVDGKDVVRLQLVGKEIDTFDYLTDQPSRLIVDIFKKGPEKKKKNQSAAADKNDEDQQDKSIDHKSADHKSNKNVITELPKKQNRTPSSDSLTLQNNDEKTNLNALLEIGKTNGVFDGSDTQFDRFNIKDYEIKEESIIASKENYYIQFPMLKVSHSLLPLLNANRPVYEIQAKDNDENKQARFLKTLFDNKRHQVFLKTISWFNQKYPESEYNELLSFMWADVYFDLWNTNRHVEDFDLAMLRYRQAIDKYPNSPLVERTLMLMGYASMDRGDYLGALKLFQNHTKNRANSPNHDHARHAIAEAYLKLNRFDDAYQTLDQIEKTAQDKKLQVQASFLKGDIFFQNKEYKKAIDEYQKSQKKFVDGLVDYPNSYFNQASSQFSLQNYRESLNQFISFLKKFPAHEYSGYAMTRVGEILDILGAEKSRSTGAYLETQFRYGHTPGSILAKLRLLGIRMKAMKEKEVVKAVEEIEQLAKKSELNKIDQFSKVLIADGYSSREDFDKSIQLLVNYYQQNPTTADTDLLSNRIVKYINMKFQQQVDTGKYIEALNTHKKYATSWLKNSNRLDTKINIARAYEQAGSFKDAEMMYRDSLNKLLALKGTPTEKEIHVIEKVPSVDSLQLRLGKMQFQLGNYSNSYDYIKQIQNPEKLSDVEQIERVSLAAELLDKKGDSQSAIRYLTELIKVWKGLPELVAQPYFDLAEIELKSGKKDDAIQSLEKIDKLYQDSEGKISEAIHSKSLEMLGNIYFDKNQKDLALKTYNKLLNQYENKFPYESIRYKVGKIHFENGEIQKATESWNPLQNRKNDFWYKLAQEQLTNSNWKEDYKKYIKRIPAMSERK